MILMNFLALAQDPPPTPPLKKLGGELDREYV